MDLRLRRASPLVDFDAINYLQGLTLPSDQKLDPSEGAWWVVYEGDTPAAFAGITRSRQWADCMYLCRSGVAFAYRGRGLQKRLITLRERYARREGAAWIITDTTKNPASANSLIARGFKMFEPSAPWGSETTSYWLKKLKKV